jgi:hypothetical protein
MTPATFYSTWLPWLLVIASAVAAVYERFVNRRKDASKELVSVLSAERDTWKSMSEAKDAEFKAYRDAAHAAADQAHTQVVKLTEEVATLRTRTDITPLLQHQEEQNQINVKMLTALDEILSHLRSFKQKTHSSKTKSKP